MTESRPCVRCGSDGRDRRGACKNCKARRAAVWAKNNPALVRFGNRRARGMTWKQHLEAERQRDAASHCACCGGTGPRSKYGWHADHDHATGLFRGIVCGVCNVAIGYMEKHGPRVAAHLHRRSSW